jgi:hypothetical protein
MRTCNLFSPLLITGLGMQRMRPGFVCICDAPFSVPDLAFRAHCTTLSPQSCKGIAESAWEHLLFE